GVKKYDLIWLQGEVFPFLPPLATYYFKIMNIPYVVDYDDAVFHRYDDHNKTIIRKLLGKKIDYVMRNASLVVVGNEYLHSHAASIGVRNVKIIPTVVDMNRYAKSKEESSGALVVGWIGTPKTVHYLFEIKETIISIKSKFDVRFVAIGVTDEDVVGLDIETQPWSEESEVRSILEFDIGIMPLNDSPWERGKCGYKLIQYMACGLPVVASPVGINTSIIEEGEIGLLAKNNDSWIDSIGFLLADQDRRIKMGNRGRTKVINKYSLEITKPQLASLLSEAVEKPSRNPRNKRL
ncbi:glycosyltransferase family 4 protein, partial [PVC group bacterium]|nr:glycosyltransferase family 4 protein [PVC group bacterium]